MRNRKQISWRRFDPRLIGEGCTKSGEGSDGESQIVDRWLRNRERRYRPPLLLFASPPAGMKRGERWAVTMGVRWAKIARRKAPSIGGCSILIWSIVKERKQKKWRVGSLFDQEQKTKIERRCAWLVREKETWKWFGSTVVISGAAYFHRTFLGFFLISGSKNTKGQQWQFRSIKGIPENKNSSCVVDRNRYREKDVWVWLFDRKEGKMVVGWWQCKVVLGF